MMKNYRNSHLWYFTNLPQEIVYLIENDISNLDKDERIKALIFDNISKNTNLNISSMSLNNQKIDVKELQNFFDKTWERFHYILDSPSVEYKDINGLNKFLKTSTFKMNNLDDLPSLITNEIIEAKITTQVARTST